MGAAVCQTNLHTKQILNNHQIPSFPSAAAAAAVTDKVCEK